MCVMMMLDETRGHARTNRAISSRSLLLSSSRRWTCSCGTPCLWVWVGEWVSKTKKRRTSRSCECASSSDEPGTKDQIEHAQSSHRPYHAASHSEAHLYEPRGCLGGAFAACCVRNEMVSVLGVMRPSPRNEDSSRFCRPLTLSFPSYKHTGP